ncbi:MAG TPA: ParB/RepB/Spo0J family partition protein [Rhodothermales bacterium]|nr:ParB/RepB/Spo0J family partition protein [Rhodothermales bacterium]
MAKKQALGKGLGAILPGAEGDDTATALVEGQFYNFEERARALRKIVEIEIDAIRPNPYQPRERFGEESLAELASSIAEHGLIQPVTVRPTDSGDYELISGERRVRAARLAGLERVDAYVREAGTEHMLEWALVENIQRQDLDPIEEALGYHRLIDECSLTQAQVAVKVGKDRSTVANALRLLRLPPAIQKALRDGEVSTGHARVLVSVDDAEVQQAIVNRIIEEQLSVRSTEEIVRRLGEPLPDPKPKRTNGAGPESTQITALTDQLRSRFGTQVAIKYKAGKGRIEIEYYSREDLERVIEILLGI